MSQHTPDVSFHTLADDLAIGSPLPSSWKRLSACQLLILVGVTGTGKSTTFDALRRQGVPLHSLPDRRDLTDILILPAMQQADGLAPAPVKDRGARFTYTRRFREQYAGGMAQALTWLAVSPELAAQTLWFDGLRGENEVRFALRAFPAARYVLLDAPDAVRVERLLKRRDAFDSVSASASGAADKNLFGDAASLFTEGERARLLQLVTSGAVSADDLQAKVQIVAEERRNYDPGAARRTLEAAGNDRALILDTSRYPAEVVDGLISTWLQPWMEARARVAPS